MANICRRARSHTVGRCHRSATAPSRWCRSTGGELRYIGILPRRRARGPRECLMEGAALARSCRCREPALPPPKVPLGRSPPALSPCWAQAGSAPARSTNHSGRHHPTIARRRAQASTGCRWRSTLSTAYETVSCPVPCSTSRPFRGAPRLSNAPLSTSSFRRRVPPGERAHRMCTQLRVTWPHRGNRRRHASEPVP
jgi:hypothetical protein